MLKKLQKWFKTFLNNLTEFIVAFIATVGVYTFLLYFFRMLWALYRETSVGKKFQAGNELIFTTINDIMHQNLIFFSFNVSLSVVKICLIIALISHLFVLKRYFYDSRGLIGRVLLWGGPCSVITALYLQGAQTNVSLAFCLLPTLALFSYCFKFVSNVVPGFDEIF